MTILRRTLFAGLAGFALIACTARADSKKEGFGELTVDQVADLIARKEADIFDNNGQDTWKEGHLPTAKWVAFNKVKASDLPKDRLRKLVFYCANEH
jgi:hypothetical protein